MLWSLWFKVMFSGNAEWRLVYLPEQDIDALILEMPDEVTDGEKVFYLEKPSFAHVIIWAVESIIYATSLKFWKWREWSGFRRVAVY